MNDPRIQCFVDGQWCDHAAWLVRGLHYGDGLFETMRADHNGPLGWKWHWDRLTVGCKALNLPLPQQDDLRAELTAIARMDSGQPSSILKLIMTREMNERGYAIPVNSRAIRIIYRYPLKGSPEERLPTPIRVIPCKTRCSVNTSLAGIKHLGRLEQVMAASEYRQAQADEGLMLDDDGNLISATSMNIFLYTGSQLLTPLLDHSGVKGTMRARLIQVARQIGVETIERSIRISECYDAHEILLTNAVRGVWRVRAIGARPCAMKDEARVQQIYDGIRDHAHEFPCTPFKWKEL